MKSLLKLRVTLALVAFLSTYLCSAQSNQYLHFDGVDDYTELPNAAALINWENTITMTGWFYTDALTYGQGMMSIRGGGTGAGEMYLIQLSGGSLECRVETSTGLHQVVAPAGTIQAGVWQHIAWVFNQTTVTLYIDGNVVGSSSASGNFLSSNRPFTIGKCLLPGFNFVYKGRADEVSLWSKALSQIEIQNMMANELVGNETDLQVYYKFDQGTPGGNNTSITQLLDESGTESKHSTLHNFSLTGEESNFNGTISDQTQVIDFPLIGNKLISDAPFELEATVNSGLPITYTIVSGPATVSGSTVTLNGTSGEVIVRASQPGNENYDPAEDIDVAFQVLDPSEILVDTTISHPLNGDVAMLSLKPIQIALNASIAYPELFSISTVTASIDNVDIPLTNHNNGFYTGWWTPTAYGSYTLMVNSSNNYGNQQTVPYSFNLVNQSSTTQSTAMNQVWVYGDLPTATVEADLPSFSGAYNQIIGDLIITCPTGGCDPWDRVSSIDAQGKNGEWYEIIRYLTPYGVACQSEIDLTDFASILRGKTKFRVNLGTQGNGFEYTLVLNYTAGEPVNAFSSIKKLWNQTYQFGDPANLQPTETITAAFDANAVAAKIKLVSSGHGWGDNNTGNAAEFQENTHQIYVNSNATFQQHNWSVCNPNPDGCSPQNGTWYFDRAGWCPGSIAQFFDFDMSTFVAQNNIDLEYRFDESYTDLCHPNNPSCVSGVTCNNCNDGFNPHLIVTSYLISFGNTPIDTALSVDDEVFSPNFSLYPNPSVGEFYVDLQKMNSATAIKVYDHLGRPIQHVDVISGDSKIKVSLGNVASGIYLVNIRNENKVLGTKKIVIE